MLKYTTLFVLLSLLTACSSFQVEEELEVSSELKALRTIQTRLFKTSDNTILTQAVVDTLLELGFSDIQHEPSVGFVSANLRTEEFGAAEVVQIGALVFVGILLPGIHVGGSIDDYQMLYATVTTIPEGKEGITVRLTMQRVMRAINEHVSDVENIDKEEVYAEFFKRIQEKLPANVLVLAGPSL